MELVWAENIVRKFNKPVLLLTPLAVGPQMVKEGEKFGIECRQSRSGKVYKGITVTNYQKLHRFDPKGFAGVVADESGCIKSEDSTTRREVTDFLAKVNYRLLATATPAPNDYMELGTSSEALGNMSRGQMLGMFFTHEGDTTQKWDLKGHARKRFWQWVCTWARACRKPSDLGFDDTGFILPELSHHMHVVKSGRQWDGFSYYGANTLDEQREERRLTLRQRCEKVAEILPKNDYAIVWCHLNPEGDLLQKLIPGSVQVAGCNSDQEKEERLAGFANGEFKVLITKPSMGGWGLNYQHCNFMTMFPNHSAEQMYQAKRRCWRFGQKRPVQVHFVTSEGECRVVSNMKRKELAMAAMYIGMVNEMNSYQLNGKVKELTKKATVPSWL